MFSISSTPMFLIFQVAVITLFLLSRSPCYADDTNALQASLCDTSSGPGQSSTWTKNLNTTFTSLEENVILNNGYYKAEAGREPDKVHAVIQCRGDISKSNCMNCTRKSFTPPTNCQGGRSVTIWQKWCYLRYSNVSFYGVWEKSRSAIYPNSSTLDDPIVAGRGKVMMAGLAAAAPREALMFAKSEIDDGKGGKRYGLVQCTRDLGKSSCRDCLEYLSTDFGTDAISDLRNWDVYGVGCFMFYHDYQFYFNLRAQDGLGVPNAANSALAGLFATAITILTTAMAFL